VYQQIYNDNRTQIISPDVLALLKQSMGNAVDNSVDITTDEHNSVGVIVADVINDNDIG
jgi:hypothetical protein